GAGPWRNVLSAGPRPFAPGALLDSTGLPRLLAALNLLARGIERKVSKVDGDARWHIRCKRALHDESNFHSWVTCARSTWTKGDRFVRTTKWVLGAVAAGFVLSTATIASAQTTAKNTLYVEGGGPGGPWSFNYERLIGAFNLRAGVGHFGASDSRMTTFPLGLNFIG